MKKTGVALIAVMFSIAAVASEKSEKKGFMCEKQATLPVSQNYSMSPSIAPTFYVTNQADFKACQKMARKQGARVIINPDA